MSKHRESITERLIDALDYMSKDASQEVLDQGKSNELIQQLENFLGDHTMTLLIPDRDREQREDFIWCLPVERVKWAKWYDLSKTFKTETPQGVRYMNRMEGRKVRTILIMPAAHQSDDEAMTACAYLRMVKQVDCRMYVIRCTDDVPNASKRIMQIAGVDPNLTEDVDDGNPSNAQDTCAE